MKASRIKRAVGILAMAVCMLLMCGCVRLNIGITIRSDGNYDLDVLFASMDSGLLGSGSSDDGFVYELEGMGLTVINYSDDDYVGYEVIGENITYADIEFVIQQLGILDEVSSSSGSGFGFNVEQNGSTYIIDAELMDAESLYSLQEDASLIKAYGGSMTVSLTFPSKVKTSNATSVSDDGKTLTWDILSMDTPNMHVEYSVVNPLVIILVAVLA